MTSSPRSASSRHRVSATDRCAHAHTPAKARLADFTEFRLLGPVEVWRGGSPIPVGGPRETKTLATLLLNARRTISVGQLVRALWDDSPPKTANEQVRNNVARLRRRLATDDGPSPVTSGGIVRADNGLAVSVDRDPIDIGQSDRLVRDARAACDRADLAAARDRL